MKFANTPALETERLRLRKFTKKDREALLALHKDPQVNRFLPWFPLKNLAEATAFWQEHYASAYETGQSYQYAICLKSRDIPIGYVHVETQEPYDFGYGLSRQYWHKGIMTEACKKVLEQIRSDGIPYITATHDVKNPKSGEVMKRLGMRYRYSYQELWQPKKELVLFRMYQLNFKRAENWVYQGYWNRYPVHFIERNEDLQADP